MPIYAYRCASCGYEKDVLQKLSDAPLTQCPECGKESFSKQVTAAGFQLKGSGWYVTDFRGGNTGANAKPANGAAPPATAAATATPDSPAATSASGGSASAAASTPAASTTSDSSKSSTGSSKA
jgi:putative FmdB family regulatory protein